MWTIAKLRPSQSTKSSVQQLEATRTEAPRKQHASCSIKRAVQHRIDSKGAIRGVRTSLGQLHDRLREYSYSSDRPNERKIAEWNAWDARKNTPKVLLVTEVV